MADEPECLENHEANLLLCFGRVIQQKNIELFRELLDQHDMSNNPSLSQKIFEKTLQTAGCDELLEEYLRRGYNTDIETEKALLHHAVESQDPKILKILLKNRGVETIDYTQTDITPLNSLARHISPLNYNNVLECMEILIAKGANANIPDENGTTPMLHVLKNESLDPPLKEIVLRTLLRIPGIDVDSQGDARRMLSGNSPNILRPPIWTELLLSLLEKGNETEFLTMLRQFINDVRTMTNMEYYMESITQLLVETIKQGCNEGVRTIVDIERDLDLDKIIGIGIETASNYGNWEALKTIFDAKDRRSLMISNPILTVMKKLDEQASRPSCDYYKCLSVLLDLGVYNINEIDMKGWSPLHYAVCHKNEEIILKLLQRGAYLGRCKESVDVPIRGMRAQFLEDYLDTCITATDESNSRSDNFEIIFDFKNFLMADVKEEILPVQYIAETAEFRYLLNHPIITSLMFFKWDRLLLVFYMNFILYSIFYFSIMFYIGFKFSIASNDSVLTFFGVSSYVGLGYMIFRQLVLMAISPRSYFTSAAKYLESAVVLSTIVMLILPSFKEADLRFSAVCTLMLATVNYLLLLGALPFRLMSTHMIMLQTVARTFFESFYFYFAFILAFSTSFIVLLGPTESSRGNSTNSSDSKFAGFFTSAFKTIVMVTGEYDMESIDFRSSVSYIAFLLFVFFISIVMLNLLNGMAVSDTQAIKSEAELNYSIRRATLLLKYEKFLAGRSNFEVVLLSLPYIDVFNIRLGNLFPDSMHLKRIKVKPNKRNKILIPKLSKRYRLRRNHRDIEEEEQVTFLSHKGRFFVDQDGLSFHPILGMDPLTVENALSIIQKRQWQARQGKREEVIQMQEINRKLDELLKRMNIKLEDK